MYKNITLFAFISTFMLTACGGGGSSTVPTTSTASSSATLTLSSSSKATVSSSKSSQVMSSSIATVSSVVSSASLGQQNFSSSQAPVSSVAASSIPVTTPSSVAASSVAISSIAVASSVKSSSIASSLASSSSIASSVKSSSSVASSVKSSSSLASSIATSSSSFAISSSSVASSAVASIYHVRGSFNEWNEGSLMLTTSTANVFELCVNFLAGDEANGGPRFKIDPSGAWGDAVPAADYTVAAGWVKISFNSTTKAITTQQNLQLNCGGASSSSVATVASSSAKSSSSTVASTPTIASSSVKSSSSIASSSIASSSVAPSSSSVASSSVAAVVVSHHPGEDCKSCHTPGGQASSKVFTVSGTVYTSAAGTTPNVGAIVVLKDSQKLNEVVRLVTDNLGNFYTYQSLNGLALSDLHPQATGATLTKTMTGQPNAGSCNSCHTDVGEAGGVIWTR